jgi:hypothetical protein
MSKKKQKVEEPASWQDKLQVEEAVADNMVPAAEQPQTLALSEVEVFKLRAYEAEARAALAEWNLKQIQRQIYLAQIDPQNKLAAFDQEMKNLGNRNVASKNEYAATIKAIEERLKISMKDFSFDDTTGLLVPV